MKLAIQRLFEAQQRERQEKLNRIRTELSLTPEDRPMFIAYLIPRYDVYLAYEDGLGHIATGETREEAIESLRQNFIDETMPDSEKEWNDLIASNDEALYALHVCTDR